MSRKNRKNRLENKKASNPTIHGNRDEHSTDKIQAITTTEQGERAVIDDSITQPPTKEEQWQNEQKGYWERQIRVAKWLNWITVSAALVGLGGLIFLYIQINVAKQTAQITLDQLHISQRPWVGIVEPIIIDKPLTFDDKGATIGIKITLKNFGVSPANATVPITNMMLTTNLDDVVKHQKEICSWPAIKSRIGNIVFPNQEVVSIPITITVDPSKISSNKNGMTEMWLVGCIPYWDQFGMLRSTALFYMFNFLQGDAEIKPIGVIRGVLEPYFFGNVAR